MIVWEDFMAEDVTFCGVFDGHCPHGHLVARKVRDTLPLKLSFFMESSESKKTGSGANCCNGDVKSDVADPVKDTPVEDKVESLWREVFLKLFKAMDKELRSHPNLDCSTAVTVVKQGQNLFIGNIGDSRATMESKDINKSKVATQLTVDLKLGLPSMLMFAALCDRGGTKDNQTLVFLKNSLAYKKQRVAQIIALVGGGEMTRR